MTPAEAGSPREIFSAFLKLGLTSFGGPVAHFGYFLKSWLSGVGGSTNRATAKPRLLRETCGFPSQSATGWRRLPYSRGCFCFCRCCRVRGAPKALRCPKPFTDPGALVFGGGRVVLPLLHAELVMPGWTKDAPFLAGYGLVQAAPGPLFTFAASLGAVVEPPPNGVLGAAIALVAIFLPGLLLVYCMLPFWNSVRARPAAQAAMRGANAAVVGIVGLALYDPIWVGAVRSLQDFALSAAGFLLLTVWRAPAWVVVIALAAGDVSGRGARPLKTISFVGF